jgi:hypothetical protein
MSKSCSRPILYPTLYVLEVYPKFQQANIRQKSSSNPLPNTYCPSPEQPQQLHLYTTATIYTRIPYIPFHQLITRV